MVSTDRRLMTPAVVHSQNILRLGLCHLGQYGVVSTGNPKWLTAPANRLIVGPMGDLCGSIWCAIAGLLRSRTALQMKSLFFATNSMGCVVDRRSGWPSAGSIALCLSGFIAWLP